MAIINLGSAEDKGKLGFAFHLHNQDFHAYVADVPYDQRPVIYGPHVYATYLSHEGLCLRDYERNGYDDSDFRMIVWNPETKQPEDICFASTRGWSYPCYGSWVDATPEVKAEYASYVKSQEDRRLANIHRANVVWLCALRTEALSYGKELGFAHYRLTLLRKVYNRATLDRVVKLLTSTRIRSAFKLKLRAQLVAWLQDTSPQYKTPFSPRQLDCI